MVFAWCGTRTPPAAFGFPGCYGRGSPTDLPLSWRRFEITRTLSEEWARRWAIRLGRAFCSSDRRCGGILAAFIAA